MVGFGSIILRSYNNLIKEIPPKVFGINKMVSASVNYLLSLPCLSWLQENHNRFLQSGFHRNLYNTVFKSGVDENKNIELLSKIFQHILILPGRLLAGGNTATGFMRTPGLDQDLDRASAEWRVILTLTQ